jgi:hypothetical protein
MVIWCIYRGECLVMYTLTARASILITIREQRQRTQNGLQFWIIFNAAYMRMWNQQKEEHNAKAEWLDKESSIIISFICVCIS